MRLGGRRLSRRSRFEQFVHLQAFIRRPYPQTWTGRIRQP